MTARRVLRPGVLQIGIDTSGTFADFVVRTASGVRVHEVLSTPDDQARAVLAGFAELFPGGWVGEITYGGGSGHARTTSPKNSREGWISAATSPCRNNDLAHRHSLARATKVRPE
jgi:hypothetical protein